MLLAGSAVGLAASCGDSRFPVCSTNDDCKASKDDPGKKNLVCYDLRCVECHHDGDCPSGHICTRNSECKRLSVSVEADKPLPGEAGSGPREPEAWEACVKACEDADCVSQCDKKFE